ncbi:hypothetical protein BJ878DRAFT_505470 [Calycina marina]|uniref:DUF7707 domain-containing protein n=1 Tax=Calycina marina TaxID=1763456 RepID=A0A9P7Z492_9HELO|nr:hypothetical protein BJ878DRAFT_505470 [Calycina marina]
MLSKVLVAVALFTISIAAQTTANSTIDASTVDLSLRNSWCVGQLNTCGTLCAGDTQYNTCDGSTLNYTCTCAANDSAPGLEYYLNTMPTYICEQVFAVCNTDNAGVASALAKCLTDEETNCGQIDASELSFSSSSSSASATATATSSGTAGAASTTQTDVSTSSSEGAAAATLMAMAGNYGSGAFVAGAVVAFGMLI